MTAKQIFVANAPVSYGAFEVTVGFDPNVPDGLELLDAVAEAGYDGIDLGPMGYLGEGEELGRRLAERNLGLAGAYIEFSFHDPEHVERMMPELDALLDTFDAVAGNQNGKPAPRPTIADAGSDLRRANVRAGVLQPELRHSEAEWKNFAAGLNRVVDRCEARGYGATLHCETGSYLESTFELERALESSSVGVCLETGHQLVGGGDVFAFLEKWIDRINHVHLKDVDMKKVEAIIQHREPSSAIWANEAFPRLGQGDLGVPSFVEKLLGSGYQGWLVVEQDIFPKTSERFAQAIADQIFNRKYLAELGL